MSGPCRVPSVGARSRSHDTEGGTACRRQLESTWGPRTRSSPSWRAASPSSIPNAEGSRITPSVVGFSKTGEILVGEVAKRQAITNPDRTVRSIKREMGAQGLDARHRRQEVDARRRSPRRSCGKLKRDAEAYLGDKVTQAVVTVPGVLRRRAAPGHEGGRADRGPRGAADHQRADGGGARLRAGQGRDDQTVLVFDLGGGTFDVSLLEIGDGVFEVKATARRHPSRRRRLGPARHRLAGDGVQERARRRPVEGPDGDAAAEGGRGEGEDRAVAGARRPRSTCRSSPRRAEGPLHLEMKLTRAEFERMTDGPRASACNGPVRAGRQGLGQGRRARSTT